MSKTIAVQIGNSDNKLTQNEWSHFHAFVNAVIMEHSCQMHFSGASNPTDPWQNATWIFEPLDDDNSKLISRLANAAHAFKQDSIALTEGITQFVAAAKGGAA